jgi:Transcription factor IIA, alpha/beta subunit
MSNTQVGGIYQQIISDVVESSRVDFEEGGVEEQVLEELRQVWPYLRTYHKRCHGITPLHLPFHLRRFFASHLSRDKCRIAVPISLMRAAVVVVALFVPLWVAACAVTRDDPPILRVGDPQYLAFYTETPQHFASVDASAFRDLYKSRASI